jgi:hypothetical protein
MSRFRESARTARLAARIASLIVGAAFLLILALSVTNEDPPTSAGVTILALLALELAACAAAWRWEHAGGIAVVAGATALAAAAWASAPGSAEGGLGLAAVAIYGLPFLLVGLLFLLAGRADLGGRTRSERP